MITLFWGEFAARDTLRFVEEKAGIGLWCWELHTNEMAWSRGVYDLLGLEVDAVEPSYDRLSELIHPEDRLRPGDVERLLREGLPISRDFRVVQRSGRVRWLANRGEVLLGPSGQPERAIGLLMDATRQHEALMAMRFAEERYTALGAAVGARVWTSRGDGSGADHEWLALTGRDDQASPIGSWMDLLHSRDRDAAAEEWARASAEARLFAIESRLVMRDEEPRWFSLKAAPIAGCVAGGVREWMWACRDIHDSKSSILLQVTEASQTAQLTGAQIRAARGLLNWSVRDLSEASNVSPSVIRRLEEFDGLPGARESRVPELRAALEEGGAEFLFPSAGKPGVRLR